MARHLLTRIWIPLLLAVVAAAAAFVVGGRKDATYESSLTFVLRPATDLDAERVPDAIRNLADNSGQLRATVAAVLSTDQYLQQAAQAGLGRQLPDGYTAVATVEADSDLLTIAVDGPDPAIVERVAQAYRGVAAAWLADVYRVYQLELLSATEAAELPQGTKRLVVLAALLGGLLGIGIAYAEWRARHQPGPAAAPAAIEGTPEELTARLERIEALLARGERPSAPLLEPDRGDRRMTIQSPFEARRQRRASTDG